MWSANAGRVTKHTVIPNTVFGGFNCPAWLSAIEISPAVLEDECGKGEV
jgi:hypothetical protein